MHEGAVLEMTMETKETYKFTKVQFAEQVGITTNAMRMRMRKGKYKAFYIKKNGRFWFSEWPVEAQNIEKIKKRYNRGGHSKNSPYPNHSFYENNQMKKYLAAKGELTPEELALVPVIERKILEISDNENVVYFATYFDLSVSDENRLIKIGKSKERCLENRLISVQTGCPYELTLLTYVEGETEEFYHDKFEEHNVRGEWFKYLPVVKYLKKEYEGNYIIPEDQIKNFRKIILEKNYSNDISKVDEKFNDDSYICNLWFNLKTHKQQKEE
jgi:hypothetical protein